MDLIKKITDSDFLGGAPEFLNKVSRYGSRGVVVDETFNTAMMYMSKLDLYKLPGGGVEKGERACDAFLREIKEETGYGAEIIYELGYIEEHKKRNNFLQYSYCYTAKAHYIPGNTMLSESEMKLGMQVKWMTLDQALEIMRYSALHCDDYSTKFMISRDQAILEQAIQLFSENKPAMRFAP